MCNQYEILKFHVNKEVINNDTQLFSCAKQFRRINTKLVDTINHTKLENLQQKERQLIDN